MKIVCLVENTSSDCNLASEHGLCFYVETLKHKLLVDTGATSAFIDNAEKIGVDLTKVDTVFLSHGHYDHCGGVMAFAEINPHADIYINKKAFADFWMVNDSCRKYIGIDRNIMALPQLKPVDGELKIDDELWIFNKAPFNKLLPLTNNELMIKTTQNDLSQKYVFDNFEHEQYLEINCSDKKLLFSGCAHKGIVNIISAYKTLRGTEPDYALSGFHTMNKNGYSEEEQVMIGDIAKELLQYKTVFYTCHCTGLEPYAMLKKSMGGRINYISTGNVLEF